MCIIAGFPSDTSKNYLYYDSKDVSRIATFVSTSLIRYYSNREEKHNGQRSVVWKLTFLIDSLNIGQLLKWTEHCQCHCSI